MKGIGVFFDILGFIILVIFLFVFMYGFFEVNLLINFMGWSSFVVFGVMWIVVVIFIFFFYFEFIVKILLINLCLFVDRDFVLFNLILFVFGIGMFGSMFLILFYL